MYKLTRLPPSQPYSYTGRVYKKVETRKFYAYVKSTIKEPPDWLFTWQPPQYIKLTVQFVFKGSCHADPENLNKALVNAIMFALQKWNTHFDDQFIYIQQLKPLFGKKDSVLFSLEVE